MIEYMIHCWGGAWNEDANPSIEKDYGIKAGYHYFKNEAEKDEFLRINRLLATLPQEQSETLRLRIYSECTFSEIAEIMQVPVTTAKSRFKYGIEKLRENLALDNFLTF